MKQHQLIKSLYSIIASAPSIDRAIDNVRTFCKKNDIPISPIGTENSKTRMINTYRKLYVSCPDSCALKHAGCYANKGHTNIHAQRPTSNGDHTAGIVAILMSARFNVDVRLHISGDMLKYGKQEVDTAYINALCNASKYVKARKWPRGYGGNVNVYYYTHIPMDYFGPYRTKLAKHSIFGLQSLDEGDQSICNSGCSLVINNAEEANTKTGVICPQQTGHVAGCADCGLCLLSAKGKLKKTILFVKH